MHSMTAAQDVRQIDDMSRRLGLVHSKYRLLWMIGCETGLRVSDILHIRANIPPDGMLSIRERKTHKMRHIMLSPQLIAYIAVHTNRHRLSRSDYLVFSRNYLRSKPLSRSQAYRILRREGAAVGLYNIGTHGMRKTYARALYRDTGDIVAVQHALNHRYITTTLIYLTDGNFSNLHIT